MSNENFQGIHDIPLLYWLCFTATSRDALEVSPAVLSMCKNISHIQVYNYLRFSVGGAGAGNRWETTNSHPPGLVNQKRGAADNHIYYILPWQGFAMPFTRLSKLSKFFEPNQNVLTFLHQIIFCVGSHTEHRCDALIELEKAASKCN